MSPATLVLSFAMLYWPSLLAVSYALHEAGSGSGTASNLLVFVAAVYLATRRIPASFKPARMLKFLAWCVFGIALCDAVAQAAFAWYLARASGNSELWRSLPFVAATTVVIQAVIAYYMLRSRLGASERASRTGG